MPFRFAKLLLICSLSGGAWQNLIAADTAETKVRAIISQALLMEDGNEQAALVRSLSADGGLLAGQILSLWREGGIYYYVAPDK